MTALCNFGWILLGNYYRKICMYEMKWDPVQTDDSKDAKSHQSLNYKDFKMLIGGSYGGPLGVLINPLVMHIYSGSGKFLSNFTIWDRIVAISWSELEHLIFIYENGHLKIVDFYQKAVIRSFEFLSSDQEKKLKIVDARFFRSKIGTGLAVLMSSNQFFLVNNVYEPKKRNFSKLLGNFDAFHLKKIWTVISHEKYTEIIYAIDMNIFAIKEDAAKPVQVYWEKNHDCCAKNPASNTSCYIVDMAVSLNAKHLAVLCSNGTLLMGSEDFSQKYLETSVDVSGKPSGFCWCGTEAVICAWNETVRILSTHGKQTTFVYDSNVHLIEDIDSVRIVSRHKHEIVQKVPRVVQDIYRMNSTLVGNLLLESSNEFAEKNNYESNKYLQMIGSDLETAIGQCVEAAAYEFDNSSQIRLLRAAQYGKCFVPDYDNERYMRICKTVRVLNMLKQREIAIPLTFEQFDNLTITKLIEKMTVRRHFYLAIEIAKFLKVPRPSGQIKVLKNWAFYKIAKSDTDENVLITKLNEKLRGVPGIPFYEIAEKARSLYKRKLAVEMLSNEVRTDLQVKLLLELDETSVALHKALACGDPRLILSVIVKLSNAGSSFDSILAVAKNASYLRALYLRHVQIADPANVLNICRQKDDHFEIAAYYLTDFVRNSEISLDRESIRNSQIHFRQANKSMLATMCEKQLLLLDLQKQLESRFERKFVGKTILQTLSELQSLNDTKLLEKFKLDFRVVERK